MIDFPGSARYPTAMKTIPLLDLAFFLLCSSHKSEADKPRGHVVNIANQPVDRATIAMDKLGSAIADASGDCLKLGTSLRAWLSDAKELAGSIDGPKKLELAQRMNEYAHQ